MTNLQRVEAILKASRLARNSDIELFIIYMQKAGMNLSNEQIQKFRELPDMQTLGRIRRKLQEQGKYEADPEVNEVRYNKFKQVKSEVKQDDPEKAVEALGYRVIHEPWEEQYK
jgi:hypothetical protein